MAADFGDLIARSQHAEGQRRILPGGDYEMQALRWVLQQQTQQLVDGLLADEVIIVQHQDEVAFKSVQLIDQASDDHANSGEAEAVRKGACLRQCVGKEGLHGGQEVGQKDAEVIVGLIQRNPGVGEVAGLQPGAQQGALAKAGRRGNQDQRAIQAVIQHFFQARAMNQIGRHARSVEFRLQ